MVSLGDGLLHALTGKRTSGFDAILLRFVGLAHLIAVGGNKVVF